MGSDPLFFSASCLFRLRHPPVLIGAAASWWGYMRAWITRQPRLDDPELQRFIRRYQRRALIVGKRRAVQEIDSRQAGVWQQTEMGLAGNSRR